MKKSQEELNKVPNVTGIEPPTNSVMQGKSKRKEFTPFARINRLKFKSREALPISTRDYGLMRSTNKSSTPFPRADQGVDANLLKARLNMRRDYQNRRPDPFSKLPKRTDSPSISDAESHDYDQLSMRQASRPSVSVFRRQSLTKDNYKEILSLGTPHPKKGVALNAKMLTRRLTDINGQLKLQQVPSQQSPPSPPHRSQRPRKKKVLMSGNAESLSLMIPTKDSPVGELVSQSLSRRLTQMDYDASQSSFSGEFQEPELSFAERRRLFHEGEFTIAKYGRKMSDVMMAAPEATEEVLDNSMQFAQRAKEELETYMKSQGLIKISNDQVTMTRNMLRGSVRASPTGSSELPWERRFKSKSDKSVEPVGQTDSMYLG
ncbi:uncharacterized protein LOC108031363 [Drosophila biarmipes]|uniref:uncharacterized protein LOC108031363 n=1 Tax=Drosophila biarmipes TaxID=125945 RepID=UPI0007E5D044|nr:uncharacterized protein LOC108031363 [Drosophila biarmipes]